MVCSTNRRVFSRVVYGSPLLAVQHVPRRGAGVSGGRVATSRDAMRDEDLAVLEDMEAELEDMEADLEADAAEEEEEEGARQPELPSWRFR